MKRVPIVIALLALAWIAPAFAGTPPAKPATAAAKGAAKSDARLDEVHIKGEILEPQVLFVVGRERRRFLDFQHRRYLAGLAGVGAAGPAWVRVADSGRPAAD